MFGDIGIISSGDVPESPFDPLDSADPRLFRSGW